MDCCKPKDDCEIEGNGGGCCGGSTSGCELKIWIIMGIIVAIWIFTRA